MAKYASDAEAEPFHDAPEVAPGHDPERVGDHSGGKEAYNAAGLEVDERSALQGEKDEDGFATKPEGRRIWGSKRGVLIAVSVVAAVVVLAVVLGASLGVSLSGKDGGLKVRDAIVATRRFGRYLLLDNP